MAKQAMTIFVPTLEIMSALQNPQAKLVHQAWVARRDELVARAEAIEQVAGETSQQAAVNLLGEVQDELNTVETARKAVKDPFLQVGKRIDAAAKDGSGPLEEAKARIKKLLAEFQARLLAAQEAERKRQETELARLREERAVAEMAGNAEAVLEADLKAVETMSAPAIIAPKATGMAVQQRWVATVVDAHRLYAVFPELVKLEPRAREIQATLNRMAETDPNTPPQLPGCEVTLETDVRTR